MAVTCGQIVVCSASARQNKVRACNRQRLARANILGVKGSSHRACQGRLNTVGTHHVSERDRGVAQIAAGIIDLAAHQGDGQFALGDGCRAANH